LLHTVAVEVVGQLVDKVELVANNDERHLIGQSGFHQEVTDTSTVVAVVLVDDTFDFLDLSRLGSRLDVVVNNLGVLSEADNALQVHELAFVAVDFLEQLDDNVGVELIGSSVLLSNQNGIGQVLGQVVLQQVAQQVEHFSGVVGPASEVIDPELAVVNGVTVLLNDTTGITSVIEELKSTQVKSLALAQFSDLLSVETSEKSSAQDEVSSGGVVRQVNFEQSSLQSAVFGLVTSHDVQHNSADFLNLALVNEQVKNGSLVDQRARLVEHQNLGEFSSTGRVVDNKSSQESHVVGSVALLLGILDEGNVLTGLSQQENNLVLSTSANVDAQGELRVSGTAQVSQFFTGFKLM
jgi:hypothetical protein